MEKGYRVDCLDKGYLEFVGAFGSDQEIVDSARLSYGDGTTRVSEDKALIDYLYRHWHLSPFEIPNLTFKVKAPIFVLRQWMRHRTFKFNEVSGRYSVLDNEAYLPDESRMVKQSSTNKQGSSEETIDYPGSVKDQQMREQQSSFAYYNYYNETGLTRELARNNLPLSTYSTMVCQCDLRNLLNFLRLRLDSHAQYEIRVYAEAIASIVEELFPWTWEAFEEHTLYGKSFSRTEIKAILYEMGFHEEELGIGISDFLKLHKNYKEKRIKETLGKLGL